MYEDRIKLKGHLDTAKRRVEETITEVRRVLTAMQNDWEATLSGLPPGIQDGVKGMHCNDTIEYFEQKITDATGVIEWVKGLEGDPYPPNRRT